MDFVDQVVFRRTEDLVDSPSKRLAKDYLGRRRLSAILVAQDPIVQSHVIAPSSPLVSRSKR